MKLLILSLLLVFLTTIHANSDDANKIQVKQSEHVARWGIPGFEDEACVLCQYVVERVQNRVVQRLEQIDRSSTNPSTTNPFELNGKFQQSQTGFANSVAEANGQQVPFSVATSPANYDLSFEPNINTRKDLIRSLRSRWGGSSILRTVWEGFLTNFCAQDKLPELYIPVCSMFYDSARRIMKLIYYGFPVDQVCIMSRMCGRNSYITSPTAVHNPIMSVYWNNKRGLEGFEGGIHGLTEDEILKKHHDESWLRAESERLRKEAKSKREFKDKLAMAKAQAVSEFQEKAAAKGVELMFVKEPTIRDTTLLNRILAAKGAAQATQTKGQTQQSSIDFDAPNEGPKTLKDHINNIRDNVKTTISTVKDTANHVRTSVKTASNNVRNTIQNIRGIFKKN